MQQTLNMFYIAAILSFYGQTDQIFASFVLLSLMFTQNKRNTSVCIYRHMTKTSFGDFNSDMNILHCKCPWSNCLAQGHNYDCLLVLQSRNHLPAVLDHSTCSPWFMSNIKFRLCLCCLCGSHFVWVLGCGVTHSVPGLLQRSPPSTLIECDHCLYRAIWRGKIHISKYEIYINKWLMITVTALPTASTLVKYTPLREVMFVKSVSPPVVVYKWRSRDLENTVPRSSDTYMVPTPESDGVKNNC